ncbi:tRNA-dihydrouridine(47) synthase [NAD(P)(+)]-like protein, partial [Coemansia sp. RSA 2618]
MAVETQETEGHPATNGEARIKSEYIIQRETTKVAEETTEPPKIAEDTTEPPKIEEEENKTAKRERKKGGQFKNRGAKNKAKPQQHEIRLCRRAALGEECPLGAECKSSHDVAAFMEKKEPDLGAKCPVFEKFGKCEFGLRCRFAMAHTTAELAQIVNEEVAKQVQPNQLLNQMSRDMQIRLRKRLELFPRTSEFEAQWQAKMNEKSAQTEPTKADEPAAAYGLAKADVLDNDVQDDTLKTEQASKRQRKARGRIDYRGKTYLAPLTTVGNLPFRRVCKGFGVDITCSEMAVAGNIIQGQGSELALLKRHASEDIFGVQLAGNRADVLGKAAEFISNNCDVDFIDLNMGCPIEIAFNNGGGSALMAKPRKIEHIVRTMLAVTDCDVTVKFRTGIKRDVNVAHSL